MCFNLLSALSINVTLLTDGLTTPTPILKEHDMVCKAKCSFPWVDSCCPFLSTPQDHTVNINTGKLLEVIMPTETWGLWGTAGSQTLILPAASASWEHLERWCPKRHDNKPNCLLWKQPTADTQLFSSRVENTHVWSSHVPSMTVYSQAWSGGGGKTNPGRRGVVEWCHWFHTPLLLAHTHLRRAGLILAVGGF